MIVCGIFYDGHFANYILSAKDVDGIKTQLFSVFAVAPRDLIEKGTVVQLCNVKDDGTVTVDFLNSGLPHFEVKISELVREKAGELFQLASSVCEEEVNA